MSKSVYLRLRLRFGFVVDSIEERRRQSSQNVFPATNKFFKKKFKI